MVTEYEKQRDTELQPSVEQHNTSSPLATGNSSRFVRFIALVIFIVVVGLTVWFISRNKSNSAQTSQSSFCFIHIAHMFCGDTNGLNLVRYDLPKIDGQYINKLLPNSSQSEYLAATSTSINGVTDEFYQYWILNDKLQKIEKISLPAGELPAFNSWTVDGKSVLGYIDNFSSPADQSRQIFTFTVNGSKLTQLTKTDNNSSPYQTSSGDIVLESSTGGGALEPYIMNSDGSNKRKFSEAGYTVADAGSFNYSRGRDSVFIVGSFANSKQISHTITYGKVTDLLKGTKPTTLILNSMVQLYNPMVSSGPNAKTFLVYENSQAYILDDSNTIKQRINGFGNPIDANLKLSNFKRSAAQKEMITDRIENYSNSPSDFQTFITGEYSKQSAACQKDLVAQWYGEEFIMNVTNISGKNYVEVTETCEKPIFTYFAKVNGIWQQAFAGNQAFSCSLVNQYKYPKQIVPACLDANNKILANNNP